MIPYSSEHARKSGTYMVKCGAAYYVGSTRGFARRRASHQNMLRNGNHPNPAIQSAFNENNADFNFYVLQAITQKPQEHTNDFTKRLRFHEQTLINQHFKKPNCCNLSKNARHNTTINLGEIMRQKWKNPEYRQRMTGMLKNRPAPSPQTREKMAAAKRGEKHPAARACHVTINGITHKFKTAIEAARHFNVTQQSMQCWLSGKTPWPGQGKHVRPQTRHMIGATGAFN